MPATGIEPVFCRLQRLVLTTITTLAWRADLDSNEDDQFWRLSGYRCLIDAWSTRADLHGCVAGLQSAGLLSCLRVRGAVSWNRTRNRPLTRRLLYHLSYNGTRNNMEAVGIEPTSVRLKAGCIANLPYLLLFGMTFFVRNDFFVWNGFLV